MVEVLAQNKDRALRYEQTYNILNFDNKLKGLESISSVWVIIINQFGGVGSQ